MFTTRVAPGFHEVTDGPLKAEVVKSRYGWVVTAEWDRYAVTDPVPTVKRALAVAQSMIEAEAAAREAANA